MMGFVGDDLSELWLAGYADADFAGDRADSKSTGGGFLALVGEHTFYPLCAMCKKQGSTANSTPEAEIVALNDLVRSTAVPALDLWETICQREVKLKVYEDNQATAKIVRSGKFKALRHVKRCHGVKLSFLTEQLQAKTFDLQDCNTTAMAADIFTKHFTCLLKWLHAIELIGMCKANSLPGDSGKQGNSKTSAVKSASCSKLVNEGEPHGGECGGPCGVKPKGGHAKKKHSTNPMRSELIESSGRKVPVSRTAHAEGYRTIIHYPISHK